MSEHKHGACSNHVDSLLTFKGCTVAGALESDGYILIFNCGAALKIRYNGAIYTLNSEEVDRLIEGLEAKLTGAGR